MPRYFYHVMDGQAFVDNEGTELKDHADARSQAIKTAGKMLSELGDQVWEGSHAWTMSVADETGRVALTLRFSADDHGPIKTKA